MAGSHFSELKPSSIIIIVVDLIAIISTFLVGVSLLRFNQQIDASTYVSFSTYVHLVVFLPIMLLSTLAVGLYNEKLRETFTGIAVRILVSTAVSYLLSKAIYQIIVLDELPLYFLEAFYVSIFVVTVLTRFAASKTPYKQVGSRRTLVLGAGTRASIIEKCMRRQSDRVGITIVGFVPMSGDSEDALKREKKIAVENSLESFVVKHDIHEIVIATDERRNVLPNDSLFNCKRVGIKITDIIDFVERETGQVAVNHIYPSWIIYGHNNSTNSAKRSFEWAFNSLIALTIFLITWPFMLATYFMIKLEDGLAAPVLYSQTRTGLHGKLFKIYKFRSMKTDAEKYGAQWASEKDPRVTKVGNFIRKYRIDELPQLLNVVRGDMGFVGPRPERPQFIEKFEESIPYYNHRLNVKPGLTGWAQLKYPYGASEEDAVEKLKFDLYYIKNRGFIFDLLILLRTAEIILFGKGR